MFRKSKPDGHTEIIEGVHLKTLVYGDQTLMTEVILKKGAVIPTHTHSHEQTGYLVSGHMNFLVDGKHHIAIPGDSWNIAGDVEHVDLVEKEFVLRYERLLSSEDSKGLLELPPNGYGLWKFSDEIEENGIFPE